MKVNINITLDIDPESWRTNYGSDLTNAEIRADAKEKAQDDLREHWGPSGLGLLTEG